MQQEKETRSEILRKRFSAKRLAVMAVFVALSYAVSFLEIPLFPATPYLQLDFGNVFIMLIGFLLGPVEGIVVCVLKECLRMIGGTVVGEIANICMTSAYVLLPAIAYRYRKGLKSVGFSLLGACVLASGVALLVNRFINFPLYEAFLGMPAGEAFGAVWGLILAFNLIKTVSVSVLTLLLYKRLSNFFKKWKV